MPQSSMKTRINSLIEKALEEKPTPAAEAIVLRILDNPDIVWEAARVEISRRVHAYLGDHHAEAEPYQMFFEGYGFRHLSQLIKIKAGRSRMEIPLRDITATDLRDYVRSLEISAENAPKIARMRRLLEEMTPYARKNRHLTFERYCELRAAGVEPPKIGLSRSERSDKVRQQWARLTPEERKAIHEKRIRTRAQRALREVDQDKKAAKRARDDARP